MGLVEELNLGGRPPVDSGGSQLLARPGRTDGPLLPPRPLGAVRRARRASKPLALIALFLVLETYGGAPIFAVPAEPKLTITKTDGLTQVDRGQTVTYTVTVTKFTLSSR